MTGRIASAEDFDATTLHAACLYDLADVSLLPPPVEGYGLDLSDAAVRGMAIGMSAFAVACSVGGLWLATLVG